MRIVEDGVNNLSDGILKIVVRGDDDAKACSYVCGQHPLMPSDKGAPWNDTGGKPEAFQEYWKERKLNETEGAGS